MRTATVFAVLGAAAAAGAAGFAIGWFTAGPGMPGPAASVDGAAAPADGTPHAGGKSLAQLRAENAELRAKLSEIERERERLSKDYLQPVLESALHGKPVEGAPQQPDALSMTWKEGVGTLAAASGGMMGRLEESIALLAEMARYGKAGIGFLGRIANDKTASDLERETALQILSYLRDPAALDVLMGFRDTSILELDFPYNLVRGHVAALGTGQIRQHIPALVHQLRTDLGADNFSPERPEVAFLLAAEHGNARDRKSVV